MEPRLRASPEQFAGLVEFMERHGDLSRPQPGPQGRIRSDRLWLELSTIINSIGGGVHKSPDKWKKVWADWKTKTKKKNLGIRQHASATGGGPNSRVCLTALEEKVLAVIGVSAVVGQDGIQEQGLNDLENASVGEVGSRLEHVLEVQLSQNINVSPPTPAPEPVLPTPSVAQETPASPPPSLHPPPRTPPVQTQRSSRRQASASPQATATSPRRSLFRARRNRGLTPFDRAASEFVAIEQRRLEHEEARDRRLHDREMERLRLESQRVQVDREHNRLLHQLSILGQHLMDALTQQQQLNSLPSTDPLPE